MTATITAVAVSVLVPLLLLAPLADDRLNTLGWAVTVLMATHAAATLMGRRNGPWQRRLAVLAMPLWSCTIAFIWIGGLVSQPCCGAAAAVVLIFATSEFGPRAGTTTLALLTAVGGVGMHAVGGWSEARFLPVLVAALGLTLALTLQLVADHDRVTAQLHALVRTDALTGLATRRVVDEALTALLAGEGATAGAGLVLVDLDEFKAVNDAHGHPGGDAALQHVARVLTESVRPGQDVVSRLGGDEMAVLLPGCPREVLARKAVELVEAVRASPFVLPDGSVAHLTISAGAAHAPSDAQDARSLYAAADRALYRSKADGRDCARVAGPGASDASTVPAAPAASDCQRIS